MLFVSSGFYSVCWEISLLFDCFSCTSNVLFSLPSFKIFCLCACACVCICACACVLYLSCVGFVELFELCRIFNQAWKILRHYSFKCCYCPDFFTPSSLLHICDTFDSVLRIFYALYSCFLSFLYFFLPKPQFQIHISESLDIFYWVCLSFSNWVFSSCCFTLKTSSKFLIAEIMFFNYNVHFITTFL